VEFGKVYFQNVKREELKHIIGRRRG